MRECSKSIQRRLRQPAFVTRYFNGDGIDIGGAPDPLNLYKSLFPGMKSCRTWDLEDGDAQFMANVEDNKFDFVHSSHCLEHMRDPQEALENWIRIVRPGGYIIISVPDEDMYEQGVWPSRFNRDHKWTFTIQKASSWSPVSVNVLGMLHKVAGLARLERLETLRDTWRPLDIAYDQTLTPVGECGIEFVMQKLPAGGAALEPDEETVRMFNQYKADQATIKAANKLTPPFRDTTPLGKD